MDFLCYVYVRFFPERHLTLLENRGTKQVGTIGCSNNFLVAFGHDNAQGAATYNGLYQCGGPPLAGRGMGG